LLKIADSLLVLEDPVVVLVASLLLKVPAIVKLVSLTLSFLQKNNHHISATSGFPYSLCRPKCSSSEKS